jgi:2-iminobutanoate/2-iminopropanoate deaminase
MVREALMMDSEQGAIAARPVAAIRTGLPQGRMPLFEWAVTANGMLYTAQIPVDAEGAVVCGGIEAQAERVFTNLFRTLAAAGASAGDVAQVLIYVTDRAWLPVVNTVWLHHFAAPFPNRASFVVAGLAREEMLVEIVAYACVPPRAAHAP